MTALCAPIHTEIPSLTRFIKSKLRQNQESVTKI